MSLNTHRFLNYDLSVEFQLLGWDQHSPPGLYVYPSETDDRIWHGVYFVAPPSCYARAVLKFQLQFPINYPEEPPIITFSNPILHPLIYPLTNILKYTNVMTWDPQTCGVIQVVWYIHYCFLDKCLEDLTISQCAHPECLDFIRTVPEAFKEKVQYIIQSSLDEENIYGHEKGDPIVFTNLLPSQFEEVRNRIFGDVDIPPLPLSNVQSIMKNLNF